MLAIERENLFPAVRCGLRAIGGAARVIEEGVAGAVVAMELVILACFLELRLGAVDLIAAWVLVVVAEQAEQRRSHLAGELDRRDRALGVELLGIVDHHVAAPAVDRGVDPVGQQARGQIDMAAAGAEADQADLAVGIGLRLQIDDRAGDIADDLIVGYAARRAHPRADVSELRDDCRYARRDASGLPGPSRK